jgi:CRISPR-associated protein Csh1
MEENKLRQPPPERAGSDYDQRIYAFFERLGYEDDQKAMFFLGRMLSVVAYLQKDKKKNVLDKVNFNGMKWPAIRRLRTDLVEKAKQYNTKQNNALSKVSFNDAEFSKHFKHKDWTMNPEEAVFFILSGYSFGITLSKEINKQNTENQ